MVVYVLGVLFSLLGGLAEGDTQLSKQVATLIVGRGGCHEDDVETDVTLNLVQLNLREDGLVRDTDGIVTAAVEGLGGQTTEVTDVGGGNVDEAIEELPHTGGTQRHTGAEDFTLAEFEVSHTLASVGHSRLLAGDFGDFGNSILNSLLAVGVLAHARSHHNLLETGNLVHVGVLMLRLEGRYDLLLVICKHCRCAHKTTEHTHRES